MKIETNAVSLPKFQKQVEMAKATMIDESAAEAAITILKSKKARTFMAHKMRETAGTNRSDGARELRIIAENLRHGDEVGVIRNNYNLEPVV